MTDDCWVCRTFVRGLWIPYCDPVKLHGKFYELQARRTHKIWDSRQTSAVWHAVSEIFESIFLGLHQWTLWDVRNPQDVSTLMWQYWCLDIFSGFQHARFFCSAFLFASGLRFYGLATGPSKVPLRTVWYARGPWPSKPWREWLHNHPYASNDWTIER